MAQGNLSDPLKIAETMQLCCNSCCKDPSKWNCQCNISWKWMKK